MSTAVFPLGMNSKPSSGYNHNGVYYNKQYISWKGSGVNANPIGHASGHIRPLTNKDVGNVFPTGFGLPRPIKHYRKGRVIPPPPVNSDNAQINYNSNRYVKSSKGTSLGGGFGGSGLLNDIQDKPGAYIVKENIPTNTNSTTQVPDQYTCDTCEGVTIVSNYYPNNYYLTNNPDKTTATDGFCCNEEYKAKRRSMYASTNLKKKYYTTTKQYLQNRCKTHSQKSFNFDPVNQSSENKPGGPESQSNTYLANCQPNSEGCRLTVYKPNNYQFAKQGAVDCSTRILKLNVSTISTNAASIKRNNNTGSSLITANQLYAGESPEISSLTKNKTPACGENWPLNFSKTGKFKNLKLCSYKQMPTYKLK